MWFGDNLARRASEKQNHADQWASKNDEQLHGVSDPKGRSKFVARK